MIDRQKLDEILRMALLIGDVRSAALFVVGPDAGPLELAAAAGITGPALDALTAAVRDPTHPVARALTDDGPTFDVAPIAPGGPALRSHLPARDGDRTVGVLALAHDTALAPADRETLIGLARAAATMLPVAGR